MSNLHRAQISVTLGGERFALRLTLQALAEIEAAFEAPDLTALGARLAGGRLAAKDLVILFGALARGGGSTISDQTLASQIEAADLAPAIEALGRLFAISFGGDAAAPRHPPTPQDA